MPKADFACMNCGNQIEIEWKLLEGYPPVFCTKCGAPMKRQWTPINFIWKHRGENNDAN